MAKKARDIDVVTIINGETKVFLISNTDLGAKILDRLTSGEYTISKANGVIPGLGKASENSLVLEKRREREEEEPDINPVS